MAFDSDIIAVFYKSISTKVSKTRALLGRPLTLAEKILYAHSDRFPEKPYQRGTDYVLFNPDRVAMQDATAQMALLQFMQAGKKKVAVPSTVHCDHLIQAEVGANKDLSVALDTNKEVNTVLNFCKEKKVEVSECKHWAKGGIGAKDLAEKVTKVCKKNKKRFNFLYKNNLKLWDKIELIAKKIYKANKITASDEVKKQLIDFENNGHGKLPVCIAKTQYSFSTDPKLKGAPSNHEIPIREVRLSSGAEFVVVVCGAVMTMPGLPKVPAADSIKLNKKGEIEGLF